MNTSPPSVGLLGDLEDARAELKDLERAEKRGRKTFAAGLASIGVMSAGMGITNNGAFLGLILIAAALFLMAFHWFYIVYREVKLERYSTPTILTLTRIELTRREVRKLERAYAEAVMKEASQ